MIAVNPAGNSEPSEECDPVSPVEILEEPVITLDADMRQSVTVRAGGSIRLFVSIKGRPSPIATWSKQDGLPAERCSIETTTSYTLLIVSDCLRSDAGKYELLLENEVGKQEVGIEVRVLDSPGAVEELHVKDVNKNSAYLIWNPPKLDGGSCVSNYIVEKRCATRSAWSTISTDVVRESLKVTGLNQGEEYFFRVLAENKFGIGKTCETKIPVKASEV